MNTAGELIYTLDDGEEIYGLVSGVKTKDPELALWKVYSDGLVVSKKNFPFKTLSKEQIEKAYLKPMEKTLDHFHAIKQRLGDRVEMDETGRVTYTDKGGRKFSGEIKGTELILGKRFASTLHPLVNKHEFPIETVTVTQVDEAFAFPRRNVSNFRKIQDKLGDKVHIMPMGLLIYELSRHEIIYGSLNSEGKVEFGRSNPREWEKYDKVTFSVDSLTQKKLDKSFLHGYEWLKARFGENVTRGYKDTAHYTLDTGEIIDIRFFPHFGKVSAARMPHEKHKDWHSGSKSYDPRFVTFEDIKRDFPPLLKKEDD